MTTHEYNFKHRKEYCHNCQTDEHVLYDNHLEEVYCTKCGTVLIDTTITLISTIINEDKRREKFIRDLWRKKRKKRKKIK